MAAKTKIQWTDTTVNPTKGCDGCELWRPKNGVGECYAGVLTKRFGKSNPGLADDFNVVETAPGRLHQITRLKDLTGTNRPDKPWLDGLPRLIFIGDMGDSFSKPISFEYLYREVIQPVVSQHGRRHHCQWLTKRPERMARFSEWLAQRNVEWPGNLWAGTSITTRSSTTRIKHLLRVGNSDTIHFLSVEPQWESIDLSRWLPEIDWVIQGGHAGNHQHPFAIEWADEMREQCADFGVALFLKQLGSCVTIEGEKIHGHRGHGGDWSKWPPRLRVRQMPRIPDY